MEIGRQVIPATPMGRQPEVSEGPDVMFTPSTLLGPVLVWTQQNDLRLLWLWDILSPPMAAVTVTPLRGKAGIKTNEMHS